MKRILSLFTAVSILIISLNISVSAEGDDIKGIAEAGKYIWNFISGEANEVYNISDEYADLRVSLGKGDSITADKGIVYSGPSCKEGSGYESAEATNRYIFIKPAYSGTLTMKVSFGGLTGNAKGRFYYNDYGADVQFDDVDLSKLQKGYVEYGAQLGSDIGDKSVKTLTLAVTAGHTYSLHTYVYTGGCTISEMYYESENIIGQTAAPTIKTPITAADTSISGTCAENSIVSVKINDSEAQEATVTGTEWSLSGLTLNEGDIISVTATAGDYKESDAVTATVAADDSVCSLIINTTGNGTVTSNFTDNSKVTKGSTAILTVTPNDKYKLSNLTVDGNEVTVDENNQYSFVINDNTEVSAIFEAKPYHSITMPSAILNGTVTIESGTIDDNGVIKAVEGDRVTFSVKPDSDYRIKTLAYTTESGETKEFKYGNFFDMPASDITINAEFKKEDVVSYVDTSFDTYDRLTFMVDGEPFFFNGIQVRPDNAIDQLKFTYDQIREMYLQAGKDGYTVVNSQIRWRDVQPDKTIDANETNYISDENITYITFNNIPNIQDNAEYAAVKLRLYASAAKDTAYTVYGVSDGTIDESFKVTSPDWDMASSTAGYHSVNVADFVNKHKNDGSVTFAVVPSGNEKITINSDTILPQLKLSRDDVYDWTHLDKVLDYAHEAGVKFELLWFATDTCQQSHEVRVPYYVHENYQKCLKSDGTPARNLGADNNFIMCKNDLDLRAKEKEVLETVFDHIADYTAEKGYGSLVVGCQVANETAVGRLHSGTDENKYFGHCYCDVCMEKLANSKSEAAYREDTLWEYLNNLSSAVKESKCSVWTRENNYPTTDTNVLAYNEQKRSTTGTDLDFIGLDPYSATNGADHNYMYSFGHESCTYKSHTYNYAQGKNLPMAMEFGGNNQDLDESVIACIAGGGSLNVYELLSGKEDFGTYVATKDNNGNATGFEARTSYKYQNNSPYNWSEENWIERVRNMNAMLGKIKYQLATKKADGAGGDKLMFFNPKSNETTTSSKNIRAIDITYNTNNNGVGVAIEESDKEIVLLSTKASEFVVNDITQYGISSVETGYFNGEEWNKDEEKEYTENSDNITVAMNAYECVKITVADSIPKEPVIEAVSGALQDDTYSWIFGATAEAQNKGTYNYADKYGTIRIGTGTNDTIKKNEGVYFAGPSCKEKTDAGYVSASETNRYILIKPTYSGTLTMKVRFDGLTGKAKGRFYYNDYGTDTQFDDIDLSALQKGYMEHGGQIGDDIGETSEQTLTMEVMAGHTYSIHSYVYIGGISLSELSYTSDEIAAMPVSLKNLSTDTDGILHGNLQYHSADVPQTAVLIAAKYNLDSSLKDVSLFNADKEGEIDFNEQYTVSEREKIKLYVWNSLNNMEPLSRVYTEADIDFYKYNYLEGKTVYAFGDSIVYGHNAPANSFVNIVAENNDMTLNKMAVNGATIIAGTGNDIITQVKNAPNEQPDFVIFDGYTNDASLANILDIIGTVDDEKLSDFDNTTFCGAFEEILYTMKQKWPDTKILYVTIHKSYARDWEKQCTLRENALAVCQKWNIGVADLFENTDFDTRIEEQQKQYLIGGAGSHPNRLGYEKFYVPEVSKMLSELFETGVQ